IAIHGGFECFLKFATGADVADQTGGVPDDEAVIGDISGHDTARADHRPTANGDAAADGAVGPQRSPDAHAGLAERPVVGAFQAHIRVYRARQHIVGETHMRPDEYTIFDHDPMKDRNVILDFDAAADLDPGVNKYTAP